MGIAKKNIAKALDNYLAKEGCLEDPFSKQTLRNYQPCVSTPNNSWTKQRKCQSTKHCLSQLLPNIFILQLRRNIPWTTMTLIVFCFGKSALERNASTLRQDLRWDDRNVNWQGHLLEQTSEACTCCKIIYSWIVACWRVQSCRSCLTQTPLVWVSVATCRVRG